MWRDEATRARVRAAVLGALACDPTDLVGAARAAHAALDAEEGRALGRWQGPAPACAAGCSSCCHVHVEVTGPEVLAVAAHLLETWAPAALAALRARLTDQARRVGGLDDEARWAARIPCALLDEGGRCSIHPARPLRCRAFHSCSAEPCRAAFAGQEGRAPVLAPPLVRAHDAAIEGYEQALAEAGLPTSTGLLEIDLLRALEPATGA
jgi:hypothetical protein